VGEDRAEDDGHAEIERHGQFALLTEEHDCEQDRVHRLEADRELRRERARMPQGTQRQGERQQRATERQHGQQHCIPTIRHCHERAAARKRDGHQR